MADLSLAYQRSIFTEFACDGSGLLVLGEGLGAWEILKGFAECYAHPNALVLLLGLGDEEEAEMMRKFTAGEHQLIGNVPFNIVKNDTLGPERVILYASGGIISITSRILLADMLTERLPTFLTTGICLFRAERITEHSLEAFILYLFREKNKDGFIKAFSEAPEPFTLGFNQLEKMMKWMRLPNNLLLFPRFHSTIKDDLDGVNMEVSELIVRPSQRTNIVQMALVDLIESSLKELVRLNPFLDAVKFGQDGDESMASLDALLGRQFDVLVRQQLEPVWHQIGFRTRQIVSELGTLRSLLRALFAHDPVTFLKYLETVLETEVSGNGPFGSAANWIVLDSANTLIQVARARVYGKTVEEAVLEEPPKWKALLDLLEELKEEECILIVTDTESSKKQIEMLLAHGTKGLLRKYYDAFKSWFNSRGTYSKTTPAQSRWPSRKRARKLPSVNDSESKQGEEVAENEPVKEEYSPQDLISEDSTIPENIIVETFSEHSLSLLKAHNPTAIIMYSQNLAFVRTLEVWASSTENREKTIQVFSIYHQDSTEEQAYLLSIRREKNAFEALIKAKATMVLPQDKNAEDEVDGDGTDALDGLSLARLQGRGDDDLETGNLSKKLIVDIRELRSALPFVLYKTGQFTLVPETITVGDYLLTPDCAVERKSIPDLIQSLASGRLYAQAEALFRTYKQPMLLIEFDESRRAFSLLGLGDLKSEIGGNDLLSRLCLLLLHFPRLRLIWSSSLPSTADIFGDLKRDQPDPISSNGDNDGALLDQHAYNPTPKAILEAMPGVNQQNIYKLMNACGTVRDVCSKTEEELQEIIGQVNGRVLCEFLHTKHRIKQ